MPAARFGHIFSIERFSTKKPRPKAYLISECPRAVEIAAGAERISAQSARVKASVLARKRIGMCVVAFAAAFSALTFRLWLVSSGQAVGGAHYLAGDLGETERAEIVDRNGVLIATNLPVRSLEIAGRDVWDADETARSIARVFPKTDAVALSAKLSAGRYVEVRRDLTPAQEEAVFNLGLPGVRFAPRLRRYYPHERLAAHVIGHTEQGRGGVMGLEHVLDDQGHRPVRGALTASIDMRAQQVLGRELHAYVERFGALAGWAAVMDVRTGEVIALANAPDFDPNAPGAVEADFRRNRAVYDRYELGSAFKIFTAAAALEAGTATPQTLYDARKGYKIADRTFRDFHGENRILTFSEVIQHSSNIGAVQMAETLGPERQKAFLGNLGLLGPLPIELAENRAPQLPYKWGPVEAATISYGHGISVTPLHLLASVSAIVNGGIYRAPTFMKVDGERAGERVISEKTSAAMRRVLRQVILDGTASFAEADGYYPIGKTATADKVLESGGYDRNARIATFVGAFPGDKPRYAILVSLDNPKPIKGTYGYATAGWNAAPLFSTVTSRLGPILGVMPRGPQAIDPAFVDPEKLNDPIQSALLNEARLNEGEHR